jgi:hypothetical protein
MGTIKLQANMELGQSYAALYIYNEGLRNLKLINEEDYQVNKKRYSRKLIDEAQQKIMPEIDMQAVKEVESMTRYFSMVLDQWHLHPNSDWRNKQLKKAKEYENRVPNARLVLDLGKQETLL